jgi:hypothetical protein
MTLTEPQPSGAPDPVEGSVAEGIVLTSWPTELEAMPPSGDGPQRRPWVRWAARMIDLNLYGWLYELLALLLWPAALRAPAALAGMFAPRFALLTVALTSIPPALCGLFVEALLLSTWGTTPGKGLLRVIVRTGEGARLSYRQAWLRALKVWVKGQALGIPLISLIALAQGHQHLVKDGAATWDRDGGFSVMHRRIGAWRATLAVLCLVAFITFNLVSWLPSSNRRPLPISGGTASAIRCQSSLVAAAPCTLAGAALISDWP